jgi:hypothetical protein
MRRGLRPDAIFCHEVLCIGIVLRHAGSGDALTLLDGRGDLRVQREELGKQILLGAEAIGVEDSGVQRGVGVPQRIRAGQIEGAIEGTQAALQLLQRRRRAKKFLASPARRPRLTLMPEPLRWDMILPTGQPLRWGTRGATWDGTVEAVMAAQNQTPPMTNDNRISATLSAQDLTDITTAVGLIRAKLPFGVSLTKDERVRMDKAHEKDADFDAKCTAYMATNPEFLPAYLTLAEIVKDRALVPVLLQVLALLQSLVDLVADTLRTVKSEIKRANYAYYHSVEDAAKRGHPGAKPIYDDLKQRFPGPHGGGQTPAKTTPPA